MAKVEDIELNRLGVKEKGDKNIVAQTNKQF